MQSLRIGIAGVSWIRLFEVEQDKEVNAPPFQTELANLNSSPATILNCTSGKACRNLSTPGSICSCETALVRSKP